MFFIKGNIENYDNFKNSKKIALDMLQKVLETPEEEKKKSFATITGELIAADLEKLPEKKQRYFRKLFMDQLYEAVSEHL